MSAAAPAWRRPGTHKHAPSNLGEAMEDRAWRNRTPQHGEPFLARLMTESHFLPQVTCQLPRRSTSGLSQAKGLRWRKRRPAETVPIPVTDWGQEDPDAGLASPQGVCSGEAWSGGNETDRSLLWLHSTWETKSCRERNLPGTASPP